MTTSISVPDPVFQEAEQLAERLEKTLDQLYTEALVEYLARRNPDTITERLNAVLDSVAEPEDRFVTETAQDVLRRVEWCSTKEWWADLPEPVGSEPGFRRPFIVMQCDRFNQSRIATALCVPLTSNVRLADSPGNFLLSARSTGLPRDSVANVSLVLAVIKR
jgi:mRNA interferase MazF